MPTNDFMDKFVAPGYSGFTAATIPEVSAVSREQGHWLTNFILRGSGLRGVSLDDGTRRTLFNFLRRTEAAFREYEAAREFTLAYLAKPNHKEYVKAIDRWEQFLSQADRAWFVLIRGPAADDLPGLEAGGGQPPCLGQAALTWPVIASQQLRQSGRGQVQRAPLRGQPGAQVPGLLIPR